MLIYLFIYLGIYFTYICFTLTNQTMPFSLVHWEISISSKRICFLSLFLSHYDYGV